MKNYRKLKDVILTFDTRTTVIVGRNNTGKTSTAEIFRRFLAGNSQKINFEDFSQNCIQEFIDTSKLFLTDENNESIRSQTPSIDLELTIDYTDDSENYGILSNFIVDLDEEIYTTQILISYRLKDGEIKNFYQQLDPSNLKTFYKKLKEIISQNFELLVYAIDPTNTKNCIRVDLSNLKKLLSIGLINAQRGLDDETYTERDVLGKSLGKLFTSANNVNAHSQFKETSENINKVVEDLQLQVDNDFKDKIEQLLPKLTLFGYPGLGDTKLSALTQINIQSLLDSHTKVYYEHDEFFSLPETYNGLGVRNLIFILFRIYEYFRAYQSNTIRPKSQLIFIEEPEAHLHPQMQEVFISQLDQIINEFQSQLNEGETWPVQFIVSTHSSHIANKTGFDRIRYYLSKMPNQTQIKDLSEVFSSEDSNKDRDFLQKYLTLSKCDLYFADVAILVEGATERILLPQLIAKVDSDCQTNLSNKYLSIIEVGGAYAHHFYKFLDFLELKTLIITDLDTSIQLKETDKKGTMRTNYPASKVSISTHSTNAGLKYWFKTPEEAEKQGYLELHEVTQTDESKKIINTRRIAYQLPEIQNGICGRSFEDAFILANLKLFGFDQIEDTGELEEAIFDKAIEIGKLSKADFAIKYALDITTWAVPKYIQEGLYWLNSISSFNQSTQPELIPILDSLPHSNVTFVNSEYEVTP
ncbi:MAG: AAA family ATPase [Bacilli bacterium]